MKRIFQVILIPCMLLMAIPLAGQESEFLIDERDNNIYLVIKFNDQWWMCQNLKYDIGEGSGCYDDDENNCMLKGRWYTFEAANMACPQGYRLPSDDDWKALEKFMGMDEKDLGLRYKRESGELGKLLAVGGGTGFDVDYAGLKNPQVRDSYFDTHAYFWTSTKRDEGNAWSRVFNESKTGIDRQIIPIDYGLSVRCIKNATE